MTGALAPTTMLAAIAVGCVAAAVGLRSAAWPARAPATAILLWQALGLGWGLAAVGALVEPAIAAYRSGTDGSLSEIAAQPGLPQLLRAVSFAAGTALLVLLCSVLIMALVAVLYARRRQRALLALLAHGDPRIPGTLVVDHPTAAAYCVPGLRSKIVVSAGTLSLLDRAELAAVLAHERAHLRERHDLVLIPFTALLRAFPRSRVASTAHRAVSLLVEMHADDRARRQRPARELATALLRFGVAGAGPAPSGALAVTGKGDDVGGAGMAAGTGAPAAGGGGRGPAAPADLASIAEGPASRSDVAARVSRLLEPAPRLSRTAMAAVVASSAVLVVTPVVLLLLPT